MNNDTQPLVEPAPDAFPLHYRSPYIPGSREQSSTPEQAPEEQQERDRKAWNEGIERIFKATAKEQEGKDALEMMQEAYERIHVHGPFFWTMNQNHNALRGCVTCGQTWIGLMAGAENTLRWHEVEEVPEEEGE